MRILVTGASGFIGRHLSEALRHAGHQVVPVSRRDGIDLTGLTRPTLWLPYLEGVDVALNAAGIIGQTCGQSFHLLHDLAPRALFEACILAGVPRVVQISALGADETAFSAYHCSKRAADDGLRWSSLDWFVLRPSLVHGAGGASAEFFMRMARLPMIPVVGAGCQRIQPVRVDDVVAAVLRCLSAAPVRRTLDVVGPEVFTCSEWLQRLRAAQGLPPARLLHVPHALVHGLMALGQPFNPLLRPDNLRMLQAGNVADVAPLAEFLGRMPGSVLPPPPPTRQTSTQGDAQ